MEKSDLDRAYELFKRVAAELDTTGSMTADQLRRKLRGVSERILDLVDYADHDEDDPADIMSRLERQSQEIAADLRRAERLMRRQSSEDD